MGVLSFLGFYLPFCFLRNYLCGLCSSILFKLGTAMAEVRRAFALFLSFVVLTCHGGFSEPYDRNAGEPYLFERALYDRNERNPALFEREPDDQNDGEPEYVPLFLKPKEEHFYGKL